MNRGDRREALFEDERDRQRFLDGSVGFCVGAVTHCIWRCPRIGQTGCGCNGCWQSGAFPRTVRLDGERLPAPWNSGGRRNWRKSSFGSRGRGIWVMMSLGRSCWNKPRFVAGAVIMGRSSTRQPKRRQRLVKERLTRMKWKEKDLQERRKGDARKVRLACELRAKTTMPLAWIAERLKMGSRGDLTWLLYRHGKKTKTI